MASHAPTDEVDAIVAQIFSPAGHDDPYPFYARLLELAPVHRGGAGVYYISGHAAGEEALRRPELGVAGRFASIRRDWREHSTFTIPIKGIGMIDPPDHTRLRRLVTGAFTARRVQAMRDATSALVDGLLDRLAEQGSAGAPVDFMAVFAFPLPVAVISAMLGLPVDDYATIGPLIQTWALGTGPASIVSEPVIKAADAAADEVWAVLSEAVAAHRRRPGDDLLTELIQVEENGDTLSEDELVTMLFNLYMAGFLTTAHLLGNALVTFESAPDQADLLRKTPDLAACAVEELLRYDVPTHLLGRTVREDVTIGEVPIPAGASVIVLPAAANRDPSVFDQPDQLDLRRQPNPHIAFGGGIHYCLGAMLAKMEIQRALPALLQRFPGLHLGQSQRRIPGLMFRGYDSLPVHLDHR